MSGIHSMSELLKYGSACARVANTPDYKQKRSDSLNAILQKMIDLGNRTYRDAQDLPDDYETLYSDTDADGTHVQHFTIPPLDPDSTQTKDSVVVIKNCKRIVHIGDLHGDISALRGIVTTAGDLFADEDVILVFHGDVIDAKKPEQYEEQIDLFFTLVLLKLKFPNRVIWLRGNHEDYFLKYMREEFRDDHEFVKNFTTADGGYNFAFHISKNYLRLLLKAYSIFDKLPIMATLYDEKRSKLIFAAHGSVPGHLVDGGLIRLRSMLQKYRDGVLWWEMPIYDALKISRKRSCVDADSLIGWGQRLVADSGGRVKSTECVTGHSHANVYQEIDRCVRLRSLATFAPSSFSFPMIYTYGGGSEGRMPLVSSLKEEREQIVAVRVADRKGKSRFIPIDVAAEEVDDGGAGGGRADDVTLHEIQVSPDDGNGRAYYQQEWAASFGAGVGAAAAAVAGEEENLGEGIRGAGGSFDIEDDDVWTLYADDAKGATDDDCRGPRTEQRLFGPFDLTSSREIFAVSLREGIGGGDHKKSSSWKMG